MIKISKMASTKNYVVSLNNNYTLKITYSKTNTFKDTLGIKNFHMEASIAINNKCEYYLKGIYKENISLIELTTEYTDLHTSFPYTTINNRNEYAEDYIVAKHIFNNYIKEIVENYVNPLLKSKKTLTGRSL